MLRLDWGQKGFLAINATAHYDFQINLKRARALGSVSTNLVYTARGTATATSLQKLTSSLVGPGSWCCNPDQGEGRVTLPIR